MLRLIPLALGYAGIAGLAVSAVVGISWLAFKHFGRSWLETHFKRELAKHQHDLDRQLEMARSNFAASLDRTTRLHTKEFEVLPEAWRMMCVSFGSSSQLMQPMQSYAAVADEASLERALTHFAFEEHEKDVVRRLTGRERDREYQALVDKYRYYQAWEDQRDFNNYTITQGIFIQESLRAKLREMSELIREALLTYRIFKLESLDHTDYVKIHASYKTLVDQGQPLRDAVLAEIGLRIHQPIGDLALAD